MPHRRNKKLGRSKLTLNIGILLQILIYINLCISNAINNAYFLGNSDGMCEADLNDFSDMLYGVIEYEKFNRLAVLDYNSCLVGNPLSIVSRFIFFFSNLIILFHIAKNQRKL